MNAELEKKLEHKPNCKCYVCGKLIYKIPCRLSDHPCCSIGCRNKYFSGQRSFVWKNGATKNAEYTGIRLRVNEKDRRRRYKRKALDLLGGKCSVCGYVKSIAALQFHHKKPEDKDYTIKDLMCGSWKKIEKEIKKCIILCANCHYEFHEKEKTHEYRVNRKTFKEVSKNFQRV